MASKYESQITALRAVIAGLDKELVRNPNWVALKNLDLNDRQIPGSSGIDGPRAHLEQALELDPVYRTRLRLADAIKDLQQEQGSEPQPTRPAKPHNRETAPGDDPGEDDLLKIRGITRAIQDKLHALGVTRFAQIAHWTSQDRNRIDQTLGLGRQMSRENWIEQAALLATRTDAKPLIADQQPVSAQSAKNVTQGSADREKTPDTPDNAPDVRAHIEPTARPEIPALHAHNDTDALPARPPAQPVLSAAAEMAASRPSQTATPKSDGPRSGRSQSGVHFFPKVVPEPRRVTSQPPYVLSPAYSKAIHAASPAHERETQATIEKPSTVVVTPVKPPKKQTRFRLKRRPQKNKTVQRRSLTGNQARDGDEHFTAPNPPTSDAISVAPANPAPGSTRPAARPEAQKLDRALSPVSPFEDGQRKRQQDAGALDQPRSGSDSRPPPIPSKAKRFALKTTTWPERNVNPGMSHRPTSNEVWPRFGDGQQWRQDDALFKGPSADEPTEQASVFGHGEEASVKIVRARTQTTTASDLSGDDTHLEVRQEDGISPAVGPDPAQHPLKRFFRALKRE